MDIQEAISEFKMENALLGVRNPMKVARNDLAISALHEQAERKKGCEFCKTFDFSEASTSVDGGYAHIHLAGGSYRFPKDKQFKFCPMCGRRLK